MTIYSVTIYINKDIEKEWLDWMKKSHLSDVINTGHFNSYKFYKVIVPSDAQDESAYCVQYKCKSPDDYSQYLKDHASRLQKEHTVKFGDKVKVARAVLEEI